MTMVAKAAKAIEAEFFKREMNAISSWEPDDWQRLARAAIEAMMEPSGALLENLAEREYGATRQDAAIWGKSDRFANAEALAKRRWKADLSAALEEKE